MTAVARGNFDLIQAHGLRLDAPAKWGLVEGYRPHRRASCSRGCNCCAGPGVLISPLPDSRPLSPGSE